MSQETTCYVTPEYFVDRGRIEDFVIHEAAHVFHNCKRRTAGLPETRTKEWLLLLQFGKRETFAYSCEAYDWIVERVGKDSGGTRVRKASAGENEACKGRFVRRGGRDVVQRAHVGLRRVVYLAKLGVAPDAMAKTSRGELDAEGKDEDGWQRDRRVDISLQPAKAKGLAQRD